MSRVVARLLRRLAWAWRTRTLPWRVPSGVGYINMRPPTEADERAAYDALVRDGYLP